MLNDDALGGIVQKVGLQNLVETLVGTLKILCSKNLKIIIMQ
jgi:hypothetical protein